MASAAIALVLANSPAAEAHRHFLHLHHRPSLPGLGVPTVHQWVADGLMAIFFLLVGLEVKREWFDGRLSTSDERRLPILAAAGGHGDPCSGLSRRDRFRPGPRARLADPGGD